MDDFAEAEIIRIINKSAKLNESNLRGCLFYSQRAVFLQPQRFCGLEPVVWISIQALPQTVNVQCKFLEFSICYWMLSDSCPRRAHTQQFIFCSEHVLRLMDVCLNTLTSPQSIIFWCCLWSLVFLRWVFVCLWVFHVLALSYCIVQ